MNKARKKSIAQAIALLDTAREEEEQAMESLPDAFRDGEKGEEMAENIAALEEAITALDKFA